MPEIAVPKTSKIPKVGVADRDFESACGERDENPGSGRGQDAQNKLKCAWSTKVWKVGAVDKYSKSRRDC